MAQDNSGAPMRIMLLGESEVGKSHYGAQLLLRLNQKTHALKMKGAATNISAFEDVTKALNEGKAAGHTPNTTYLESHWPVEGSGGLHIDLEWPDYGGEQVRRLIDDRRIPTDWRERLLKSDGWLMMVRVQRSGVDDDIFSKPLADIMTRQTEAPPRELRPSIQARLVELLQMLIFIRGSGTSMQLENPVLTVLLSCWDELGDEGNAKNPLQIIRERLPLLADFVESNWAEGRFQIMGLSALGQALRPDRSDAGYVDEGPESFGYVVEADGMRNVDLSLPIDRMARIIGRG
jgi:Double-GTPase 1